MSFLANSAFLNALGWSLLNSVWQFAICWFVYRIFIAGSAKLPAAAKHTAALVLLFAGCIVFVVECTWKYYNGHFPAVANLVGFDYSNGFKSWQTAGEYANWLMPYWSMLYLGCIVLLFFKLAFFVRQAGNLHYKGVSRLSAAWRIYIKDISSQLGIKREVKAFLSTHIDTPQVIGFLKPVILIPAACLTQLSTAQVEAVLLHELVHIKRNDYLLNLFVATLEILFFFNPFVKQLSSAIRKEREYSCDDMVIQFKFQPDQYAAALLTLERNRLIPVTYGIAVSGKNQKQLLTRIERIVGIKNKPARMYKTGAALVILLFITLLLVIHPSPVALNLLDAGPLAMADNTGYSNESGAIFSNPAVSKRPSGIVKPAPAPSRPSSSLGQSTLKLKMNTGMPAGATVSAVFLQNEGADADNLLAVTDKETRDFSMSQDETGPAPEPVVAEEPYVPSSSFSFRIVQDSSTPKIKGETYAERKAREALCNAQKALTLLNWQKIQKDLKSQPKLLAKLKKELNLQLQNLNWQSINAQVQTELQQQQTEATQEAIRQQQALREYQQTEVYYEALQRKLAEQEQSIRMSDQRLKETQKAVEDKQKKIVHELTKRRIIYI